MKIIELEKSQVNTEKVYNKINDLITRLRDKKELGFQPLRGKCEVCIDYYNWIDRLRFRKSLASFRMPDC
jgi:hypothetical protein